MSLQLDHVAFGAADLASGIDFMSNALGVAPIGGGKHELFGTHNALWRIEGNYPIYLEVIAIDPNAEPILHLRWFGLEDKNVQQRLKNGCQLLTYVASTTDIKTATKQMKEDHGEPVTVSRGNLNWQFSVPKKGNLIANGALPYLIEWEDKSPVETMKNQGLTIKSIEGNRLEELDITWPCEHKFSDRLLEVTIANKRGKEITF